MKKQTILIAIMALAGMAVAEVVEFTEDFTGGKTWGFDSENTQGGASVSAIGGTNNLTITPSSWAVGDGVYLEKLADNSGAESEEGTFNISYKVNPWALTTQTWDVHRMLEIETSGNGGGLGGGGHLMSMQINKRPEPTDYPSVNISSQGRVLYWASATLSQGYSYDEGDTDGFIDVEVEVTISEDVGDWTVDWTQITSYAGNSQTNSTNCTYTVAWTGLQDIKSYQLGFSRNAGSDPSGSIVFDDFNVSYDSGLPPEPSEPATLSISETSGSIAISWLPNLPDYTLQEKTDLLQTNWVDSLSSSTNHPVTIPVTNSTMFYRVIAP